MRMIDAPGIRVCLFSIFALDQCDVVSLQHDPPQPLLCQSLLVTLRRVIQDQVHVLVKPDNLSLNPGVDVLIQPDHHPGSVLQVSRQEKKDYFQKLFNKIESMIS